MSALVFLVHHRSVDLVGMTAANALRERMGLADVLLDLRRDDVFVFEGAAEANSAAWVEAFRSHTHWFNPNKHRFGLYAAAAGALRAARAGGADWPSPWLGALLASDRPDLLGRADVGGLASWLALEGSAGFVGSVLSWDLENGLGRLPEGHWPDATAEVLQGQLWSARVRAPDAAAAHSLIEGFAVTRSRERGLLVHPHIEGFAQLESEVAPPRPRR